MKEMYDRVACADPGDVANTSRGPDDEEKNHASTVFCFRERAARLVADGRCQAQPCSRPASAQPAGPVPPRCAKCHRLSSLGASANGNVAGGGEERDVGGCTEPGAGTPDQCETTIRLDLPSVSNAAL